MERVLRLAAAADPIAARLLLGTPESPRHVGILAIAGDRGLAGSYNSGALRATERLVVEHKRNGAEVTVWSVGKKAPPYFRFRGVELAESFTGFADRPEFADARHIAAVVAAAFASGEIDLVRIGLDPVHLGRDPAGRASAAAAAPTARGCRGRATSRTKGRWRATPSSSPSPRSCCSGLAPRALEAEIFAALLEGAASFFTAQQRAMAAATDNADELVRTLTRVMNRARQDAITTEIMEIVGGAEALRQSKGA